ncbi:MAG: hypothetical protein KAH18_00745 [Psychromonas sp.]|nr:hypothetical protein [Psychromonas sp.]
MKSRLIILFSALVKATCQHYGNAIALFENIMVSSPPYCAQENEYQDWSPWC